MCPGSPFSMPKPSYRRQFLVAVCLAPVKISSKSNQNPSWKGSSTTWWGETTSWVLNPPLVELFWTCPDLRCLCSKKQTIWEASRAADPCDHATCTSAWRRSSARWKAAGQDVSGVLKISKWGQDLPWLCTALLCLDWAAVAGSWGPGPDRTWSQSHVATSMSNAFCCCAWLGDGVLAMNYTTSVIHTCVISWLGCSWKPAVSKKFPQNLGEAKWHRRV